MSSSLIRKVKSTEFYRNLTKRKYRTPEGYYSWEDVALDLACFMQLTILIEARSLDHSSKLIGLLGYKSELVFPPVYWIERNLISSLLEVEFPDDLYEENLIEVAPYLIFVLPKGLLQASNGADIKWIGIQFITGSGEEVKTKGGAILENRNKGSDKLLWVAVDTETVGYSFSRNLPLQKYDVTEIRGYVADSLTLTNAELNSKDKANSLIITQLVVQLLLILQHKPEFVTEHKPPLPSKAKDKVAYYSKLNNVWIGKDYSPSRIKSNELPSSNESTTTRKFNPDVYPFWRRGHWRNVPVGPRTAGRRKRTLIMPYQVMGPL